MPLMLTVTRTPRRVPTSSNTQPTKLRRIKTFSKVFGLRWRSQQTEPDSTQDTTRHSTSKNAPIITNTEYEQQSPYNANKSTYFDNEYAVGQAVDFEDSFGLAEPSYPYLHEPGSHSGDGRMLSTIFESAYETSELPSYDPPPYYEHEDSRCKSASHLPMIGQGTKGRWVGGSGQTWGSFEACKGDRVE